MVHDWGGPIGLRVAALEASRRVSRLVVTDTGVFDGRQEMSPEWARFREFVARASRLPIKRLMRAGCEVQPTAEVLAAYDAPFPTEESKAAARAFPALVPLSPEDPGAKEGAAVKEALVDDERPALLLWADSDAVLPLKTAGRGMERLLKGASGLAVIKDAGHFLYEDRGEAVGKDIARWLARS